MAGLTKEQKALKALIARAIELSGVTADEFEKLSADEQAAFKAKAQAEADAAAAEAKRIADEQAAFKAKAQAEADAAAAEAKRIADEQAAFKAKAQAEADAAAAEAKRIADEQAAFKAPDVDNSHLITVAKDGEELEVHPSCLADHKRLGWKEA